MDLVFRQAKNHRFHEIKRIYGAAICPRVGDHLTLSGDMFSSFIVEHTFYDYKEKAIYITIKTMINEITIKSSGEKLPAYKLSNGNYYDFKSMGATDIPTSRTGKKEFTKDEIAIGKEVQVDELK